MCSPQPVPSVQPLPAHASEAGFTLVELLVTVLIVGVLAVIGLPAYLNQVTKAKQSEAKTTLSSIVRAQTLFRSEFNQFASSIENLSLGLPRKPQITVMPCFPRLVLPITLASLPQQKIRQLKATPLRLSGIPS